ncbi:hypothetical protein QA649_37045 [Bradyrhizobium sp. CB1717]|uniref:hypothetical protein n=1 Tax=Bradyrhizobium sp. CB1717 TaxID=3039154 RepID=UPI0024B0B175|nr:hypothetical protein [Bradyrhizobium sp. CB1717]WFU23569.1 hypothetical protein QA649_37045 [Bradyrhizobium sp. CB1717]
MAKSSMAKKRKLETFTSVGFTARGVRIILPKTDYLSPMYSRKQIRAIIADLQAALDDDLFYS